MASWWLVLIDESQPRLVHALHAPTKGLLVRGSIKPCALKQNKKEYSEIKFYLLPDLYSRVR